MVGARVTQNPRAHFVVNLGDDRFDVLTGRKLNREPLSLVEARRLAGGLAGAVPADDHDRRRRRDAADAPPRR
jgi:hypothetical protein